MRLLTCDGSGKISLKEFPHNKSPPYAILSHTWGEEEVTFQDVLKGGAENKLGYRKIRFCGEQAARDDWQYFWVDTCCIDKSSSAELGESINSMFLWYRNAAVCYVYLADVSSTTGASSSWETAFRYSKWFTRGWTLQELIAPETVEFFSREGVHLGSKKSLERRINEITRVPIKALQAIQDLSGFSVAERMAWMQGRETTREEDMAYSLLGIFNVHMPLIYSEGKDNALMRLEEQIEKKTPPQPSVSIPFSRDSDFVNRGDILDQIDRRCSEPAGRVALVGLGGVGKSQLAIEFVHRTAEASSKIWIFWVHASTQARVEESFRTIADTVKLSGRNEPKADIPLLVQKWLSDERNKKWIVVLDSADDYEVMYGISEIDGHRRSLASYLPQSRNGAIIVTTRNKDLAYRVAGNRDYMIDVGPMTQADALILVEKKLGLSDVDTATDLIQALDCVPLAISQAAAYIKAREPRSSVGKYLTEFRESERKRTRLLEHDAGDLRRDGGASNAILTTWHISFDYIRHKRPSAADLLSLMSFFDRQGIPESVLKPVEEIRSTGRAGEHAEAGDSDSENDTCNETDSIDDEFEDDVAMLRDYCLIDTNREGDEFEMHGLVQLSMRKWLSLHGQQETFKQQYIERMTAQFPTGQYENWATCQKLFPHVQVALDYKPEENTIEEWATLLYKGGWYAWLQGRYDIAERMVSKSRKARIKKLGVEDDVSLTSTSLFANLLRDQGRWEEAEKLEVQVMETFQNKLGADHPDTLTSMANLASTYRNQGRWKKAEKLEVQVMETRKNKLGADHPATLTSMANLASTFWNQGRWEEAEELEVQVMETRKNKLGADHPATLTSMANLASTYRNQGRWEEAEELEVQVMETSQNKLGADHPDTLTSMNNLAYTWKSQGRHSDAVAMMKDCVQARQRILGQKHPNTLSSLETLETWTNSSVD
ncbi:hypothetical protein Daus18300_014339 [Diaporthe australafricana]|uniref:Kinesin light chain 1 n=1 Tax=Diaporthe australafricana TaxID=127596 RepID=A0ABR3VVK7_9PEZI